jgi:hypothetical protein
VVQPPVWGWRGLHGELSPGALRGPKNGDFSNADWTSEAPHSSRAALISEIAVNAA